MVNQFVLVNSIFIFGHSIKVTSLCASIMYRLSVTLALTVFVLTIFESARESTYIRDIEEWHRMTPDKETGDRVTQWTKEMKVNPEELGDYLEGDIMLTEDRQENINYWPDGIVPTIFSGDFNRDEVMRILDAMTIIQRNTCIKFKTIYTKNKLNWEEELGFTIITSQKTGCWCRGIGKISGGQQINLQIPACTGTHTIIHELLHALGLDHEHNRVDRDLYVMINWINIPEDKHNNFYMRKTDTFGLPYDYDSIMHYSPYAFAKYPNLETITTKAPNKSIGKAKTLSNLDILKLNIMYNCSRYLRKAFDKVDNDLVYQKELYIKNIYRNEMVCPANND